ncbi:hypothetical protein TNCV_5010831 [Trichonephila clavipes]|nr:hypothetical protein TNCV_5010831 [Trichonephila clavipes]
MRWDFSKLLKYKITQTNISWGLKKFFPDFLRLLQGQNTGFPANYKTSYQCPAVWLPRSLIIFQEVKPLKGGKGFQKSTAQPLLRKLLEDKFILAVHFRSIFTMTEFSVWNAWSVKTVSNANRTCEFTLDTPHMDASSRMVHVEFVEHVDSFVKTEWNPFNMKFCLVAPQDMRVSIMQKRGKPQGQSLFRRFTVLQMSSHSPCRMCRYLYSRQHTS